MERDGKIQVRWPRVDCLDLHLLEKMDLWVSLERFECGCFMQSLGEKGNLSQAEGATTQETQESTVNKWS